MVPLVILSVGGVIPPTSWLKETRPTRGPAYTAAGPKAGEKMAQDGGRINAQVSSRSDGGGD
jgi:hypothetical protein